MATTKKGSGFSEAERSAMKARAEELRSSGRGGAKKADEAQACLDAIAALPDGDRELGERIHSIVSEAAPSLRPKTWYGMPAYVDDDAKVVCFFKPGSKFGARYATFGFTDNARLDDGDLWATEFAVITMGDGVAAKIDQLVRHAVHSG